MTLLDWQLCLSVDPSAKRIQSLLADSPSGGPVLPRLLALPDLRPADRARIKKVDERAVRQAELAGVHLLSCEDLGEAYAEADCALPWLFARGSQEALTGPRVAIVGTRGPSSYGRAAARSFAASLARAGAVIVSGGAIGIDAEAHRGALEAGGKTIAVLPGGVTPTYPLANRPIFDEMAAGGGLLLSQFAIGATPHKYMFTARNATIAAIADFVLIVEAPAKSGALVTARVGGEIGREVGALPGQITMEGFRGSHALIRDGVQLIDHPDQIIEILSLTPDGTEAKPVEGLAGRILAALEHKPMDADALAARLEESPSDILTEITLLEMEGRIMRDEKGYAISP